MYTRGVSGLCQSIRLCGLRKCMQIPPCVLAAQLRFCSHVTSGDAGRSHDATVASPMPYKSTHKGSGNTALLRRQRRDDKHVDKNPGSSSSSSGDGGKNGENLAASRSSCVEDAGEVTGRKLSPLQRRQLLFKHKAAFTLTPQALRRVKYLLSQFHDNKEQQEQQQHGSNNGSGSSSPDGICIGVRRRGCSGYSYTVKYHYPEKDTAATSTTPTSSHNSNNNSNNNNNNNNNNKIVNGKSSNPSGMPKEGDVVVEQDGVKVVVDGDALFYVIGTEMDYVVRNVEEKFTFRNPNQKYSCGCEESFMPFDDVE